jgi:transposase-like protein
MNCPECKYDRLIKFGKKWVKVGGVRVEVQQYQCKDCGRITIKPEAATKI